MGAHRPLRQAGRQTVQAVSKCQAPCQGACSTMQKEFRYLGGGLVAWLQHAVKRTTYNHSTCKSNQLQERLH